MKNLIKSNKRIAVSQWQSSTYPMIEVIEKDRNYFDHHHYKR